MTRAGAGLAETVASRSMHVHDPLIELFAHDLELLSEDPNCTPDRVLGLAMTVTLDVGRTKRHFNGVVTRLARLGVQYHYRLVPSQYRAGGAVELGPTSGKLWGLVASVSGTTLSEVTGGMVKIN